jgi:hypothetical protein
LLGLLGLLGKGYVLFGDNWYSSIAVVLALAAHGVRYVGTMRLQKTRAAADADDRTEASSAKASATPAARFPFVKTKQPMPFQKAGCELLL